MGAPTVSYKQVHSPSPRIKGSLQGLQATVRYVVDWADAFTFTNQVLGFYDGYPWKWPASPNMRATEANIEPVGVKDNPDAGGSVPGTYYKKAYIDVTFSSITANLAMTGTAEQPPANQFDPANPIEMSSFQITYAGEMIKIPNGTLKWADTNNLGVNQIITDPNLRAPESGAYYMRLPTFNLNITLHNCLYIQASNFADKIGKVNDAVMFGNCDPETVLFDGVNTTQRQMSDGTAILDATLNYKWRKSGWNVAMSSTGKLYQYSKLDNKLVYERADILPLSIILPSQRWNPGGGRNGIPGR